MVIAQVPFFIFAGQRVGIKRNDLPVIDGEIILRAEVEADNVHLRVRRDDDVDRARVAATGPRRQLYRRRVKGSSASFVRCG